MNFPRILPRGSRPSERAWVEPEVDPVMAYGAYRVLRQLRESLIVAEHIKTKDDVIEALATVEGVYKRLASHG